MKCVSCGKEFLEGVRFLCPKCGQELFRCGRCRSLSIDYKCVKCNFVGP